MPPSHGGALFEAQISNRHHRLDQGLLTAEGCELPAPQLSARLYWAYPDDPGQIHELQKLYPGQDHLQAKRPVHYLIPQKHEPLAKEGVSWVASHC